MTGIGYGLWKNRLGGFPKMKMCTKCGVLKSMDEFYFVNKSKFDRRQAECKKCFLERSRIYQKNNNEKHLESDRRWKNAHPEKRQEAVKKWADANLEKKREITRNWIAKNLERQARNVREWAKKHPDKMRVFDTNRRAREMGNGGRVSAQEIKELKERYSNTCLCCGRREPEIKLTHDHVVPLAPPYNGKNTIENSQPLCKSCNSRKGKRVIDYRLGWKPL
jgi:5-methylcytosine-specific restriction endonuclease McrA